MLVVSAQLGHWMRFAAQPSPPTDAGRQIRCISPRLVSTLPFPPLHQTTLFNDEASLLPPHITHLRSPFAPACPPVLTTPRRLETGASAQRLTDPLARLAALGLSLPPSSCPPPSPPPFLPFRLGIAGSACADWAVLSRPPILPCPQHAPTEDRSRWYGSTRACRVGFAGASQPRRTSPKPHAHQGSVPVTHGCY